MDSSNSHLILLLLPRRSSRVQRATSCAHLLTCRLLSLSHLAHCTLSLQYVTAEEKRLTSSRSCSYGPSEQCTINTNLPFEASFTFSSGAFEYSVELTQQGRVSRLASPVRYISKPSKGRVGSVQEANRILGSEMAAGMTLVLSYWAGATKDEMSWLDQPCTPAEKAAWHCVDEYTEHREWEWTCENSISHLPSCGRDFTISEISVRGGWGGTLLLCVLVLALVAICFSRREALGRLVGFRKHAGATILAAEEDGGQALQALTTTSQAMRRSKKRREVGQVEAIGDQEEGEEEVEEDEVESPKARNCARKNRDRLREMYSRNGRRDVRSLGEDWPSSSRKGKRPTVKTNLYPPSPRKPVLLSRDREGLGLD